MRQLQLTILLILTLILNVNSQDKVIKGDTVFWYKQKQNLMNELKLPDLSKSQADFAFRFWNYGQVVEIIKVNNHIKGELTNYIYHSIRKRHEILKHKTQLDSAKSLNVYEIIKKSGILALQSDNKINGWRKGDDGITYVIEHSDKDEYWFKNYWTPSSQDSFPESLTVLSFIDSISTALQLPENYKKFRDGLPRNGGYSSGGLAVSRYVSNSYGFGYLGSIKLPLGFNTSLYMTYIGQMRTDFGLSFQYKSDTNDNYELGFDGSKNSIFIKGSKTHDFLMYSYRKRKLDFIDMNQVFQDHQFSYGILINNNFSLSTGLDYRIDDKEKVGGVLGISKWFDTPKIEATFNSSIIENEIDYKTGISKTIHFYANRSVIRSTSVGLYFENFKDYNDLNISLTVWL